MVYFSSLNLSVLFNIMIVETRQMQIMMGLLLLMTVTRRKLNVIPWRGNLEFHLEIGHCKYGEKDYDAVRLLDCSSKIM